MIDIGGIVRKVEARSHCEFDTDEVMGVYRRTKQKLARIHKTSDYMPLLFEDELQQYAAGCFINEIGGTL